MPAKMWVTFIASLLGMALLWTTLVRFELAAKSASARLARIRRALDAERPSADSSRIAPSVPSQATGPA